MSKRKIFVVVLCLILALGLGAAVYAAVSYGSEDDPLITKSYLDEVLQPQLEEDIQGEIDAAIKELESAEGELSGEFAFVTLKEGESISCGLGCEIMLRSGAAWATGSPLVDTTGGEDLPVGGSLEKNHLYMVSLEGGGVSAQAGEAGLLIKGVYGVN